MRLFILSLLFLACAGCDGQSLSDYEAQSSSRDDHVLECLQDWLPLVAVGRPERISDLIGIFTRSTTGPVTPMSPKEIEVFLREHASNDMLVLDQFVRRRPAWPAFRSLCGLINRYWGDWDRLVIVERIGFEPYNYDFVAAGVTKGRIKIVTSKDREDSNSNNTGDANESERPSYKLRLVEPDLSRVRDAFDELEKAAPNLPKVILLYPNVEWPLYIVHDIKKDGNSYSFGFFGWPGHMGKEHFPAKPLDYSQAGKLIPTEGDVVRPVGVAIDSPRGRDVLLAGRTYALLLTHLLESLLGEQDTPNLSQFSEEAKERYGRK